MLPLVWAPNLAGSWSPWDDYLDLFTADVPVDDFRNFDDVSWIFFILDFALTLGAKLSQVVWDCFRTGTSVPKQSKLKMQM